ncbi:MAG: hypothetical protein MUE96_04855 [Bacteroidia bacterium]|jgi:hypothetical protein|nr:hypothetical protein [Bacteroidia bacterium]
MKNILVTLVLIIGLVACKKAPPKDDPKTTTSTTASTTGYLKDSDIKGDWIRAYTSQWVELRGINPATKIGLALTDFSSVVGTYTLDSNSFSIDLPAVPSKSILILKYTADSCFIRNDSFFGIYRNDNRVSLLFTK